MSSSRRYRPNLSLSSSLRWLSHMRGRFTCGIWGSGSPWFTLASEPARRKADPPKEDLRPTGDRLRGTAICPDQLLAKLYLAEVAAIVRTEPGKFRNYDPTER
ncbi:hypothetical protein LIER_42562 [Lithospermum erythrorhizon]|uniref:Uncharacterized protein n=1 Tax=Lithospermum erythrorhizon TaxID=34254 RepID=A0AAV3NIY3_LITER